MLSQVSSRGCASPRPVPKAAVVKRLLKDAVKDAMASKEFDTTESTRAAFDVVSDLDHALGKEFWRFREPTELDTMCKRTPWMEECRVYDV